MGVRERERERERKREKRNGGERDYFTGLLDF